MKKLLIATRNPGKFAEIKNFLSDLSLEMVSLSDLKIGENIEEEGKTYAENSAKKAIFYAKLSGLPAIADDGGIEIAALKGAPGVRSRRFFGKEGREATDDEIIEAMKQIAESLTENRIAYFRTVITLALPTGETFQVEGEVKGIIARKPLLELLKGYPYRSFFYLPQIKKYYHEAELSDK
ncbi:MAG: non-canonical purine NTP pyrophosphatase, partial [Patescibacteria group bacterium]